MAVNTRDKRFSMLGTARATVRQFQNPTGTIGAAARAMLEFLYGGIALSPPTAGAPRVEFYIVSRSNTPSRVVGRSNTPSVTASRSNAMSVTVGKT